MDKENLWLEKALEEIALESVEKTQQEMTFADHQKARSLQAAHSKKALALIRKHTRTPSLVPYVRAAAVLVVILNYVISKLFVFRKKKDDR